MGSAISSFNPRTRVGCDQPVLFLLTQRHAVSIHAPAWGATSQSFSFSLSAMRFQSTHPRGVRPDVCHRGKKRNFVSIHAPAWGATRRAANICSPMVGFNPRTRVGCDTVRKGASFSTNKFQSTHPRGVRLVHELHRKHVVGRFNPRTRVGCDGRAENTLLSLWCFNPRTRVGCDKQLLMIQK